MKLRTLIIHLALACVALTSVRAQDAQPAAQPDAQPGAQPAAPSGAQADLQPLVARIQAKIRAGQRTEEALAPELADFDKLVAKYKDKKSDDAAQISAMRAMLYIEVFNDFKKGRELLTQIKTDYPGTQIATEVDPIIAQVDAQAKAKETELAVVGKPAPELHFKWSTKPDLKKLSELKGKVVVLDFWATWCGPCIHSFPQMRELVEHYKNNPNVVIVGVTSLQGRVVNLQEQPIDTKGQPEKEIGLMPDFIKKLDMTWTVAVSDEQVFNPDYGITGIPHMTIIAPDGTVRANDLHPAMPEEMKTQKIDAILKEFHLPTPPPAKA